jgi:hypothetical protein
MVVLQKNSGSSRRISRGIVPLRYIDHALDYANRNVVEKAHFKAEP